MQARAAYTELTAIYARLDRFEHCQGILSWDQMVNMPSGGAKTRGAALSEMKVLCHGIITDPKLKDLFSAASATSDSSSSLNKVELANLREMRRAWEKETKLPASLVQKKTKLTAEAQQLWVKCRGSNDWAGFRDMLQQLVEVSRETGACLAEGTDLSPYEALIDQYEPGCRTAMLDRLFADLKEQLPPMIKAAREKFQSGPKIIDPKGPFAIEKQKALGLDVMKALQFNFDHGRLDVAPHPFCGGSPSDVRLTTRYYEHDFTQSLMGIIHETGHARYEQNRPNQSGDKDTEGEENLLEQPVSQARSMGIHESQSLFHEMQLARSTPFLQWLTPKLTEHLGPQENGSFDVSNIVQIYRKVQPGFIRVDADEICYPLHVILRYEIERALIEGTITVDDVPRLWDEKMKAYLDVDTKDNFKDGCLQDLHWSVGYFGYFPTYTLGAMYAAQFMHAAIKANGGKAAVDEQIAKGNFDGLIAYLKKNVWNKGSILPTEELVVEATGEPLNPAYYMAHLKERYC